MNGRPSAPRKVFGLILKGGVFTACVLYAVWGIDWGEFAQRLQEFNAGRILAAIGVSFVAYALVAVRLRMLVEGGIGFGSCFLATLAGLGMNNILPARLGELAKVFFLHRDSDRGVGRVVGAVFWERFFDLNAWVLLAIIALSGLDASSAVVPLVILVAGVWGVVLCLRRWSVQAERLVGRIPFEALHTPVSELVRFVGSGLTVRQIAGIGGFSLLIWGLYLFQGLIAILWVAELPISVLQGVAVFAAAIIGFAIPAAPGGMGVFEFAVVVALGWYGIGKEEALAVALMMHAIQYVPTTLAAITIIAVTDLSLKSLSTQNADDLQKPRDNAGSGDA